jgi:hypothetical protein
MVSRTVLVLAVATALLPTATAGAAKPGTFAGSLGVKVPAGAEADVRAINRATGVVARTDDVARNGRFSLSMPKGVYLVVGTVVTPSGRVIQKDIGVSLRSGQKRRGSKLTARPRKRRPKASAAFAQEKGQITPGRIAVEMPNATGSTGDADWDAFRGGINDMMMTDVFQASGDCGTTIIEVERRDELLKELEFQQSIYVDPSTRLVRNLIVGDVELRSTIAAAPGGGADVTVAMVDKASGSELGRRTQRLDRRDVFAGLDTLTKDVADDLCKLSDVYAVTLDVTGDGRFATHSSSASIQQTLRARRSERGSRVWRAAGPLQWANVTFAAKTECAMIDYVIPTIGWSVTITDAGEGQLEVVWQRDGNESTTASIDCPSDGENDPPPIPGMPGTSLIDTGPESFLVPYAGGQQAISGVVESGGDGFFNAGTITVGRSGIG